MPIDLEAKIARFVGKKDAILYASAFDANGGLFQPLLNEEDAVISDELNHASIIDGIRLCKAKRFRYKHNDMQDLEEQLKSATGARRKLIVTDGVFSRSEERRVGKECICGWSTSGLRRGESKADCLMRECK